VKSLTAGGAAGEASGAHYCVCRFVDDLRVIRSANTVRAYEADVQRWVVFCRALGVNPFCAGRRTAIKFIRAERERIHRAHKTVSARTVVRRLSAIRQWCAYLALEPEETGVGRNPIPVGSAIRTKRRHHRQ
jgi:site-specific recombinase XerC